MLRALTIPVLSAVALLAVGGFSVEAFAKDKSAHEMKQSEHEMKESEEGMKQSEEVAICKKDPATSQGAALEKCVEDKKFEATNPKK